MSKQIIIYYHIFIFLTVFLFVGNTWHVSASGAKTSKETQSSLKIKVDYSDVSLFYSVIEKAQKEGKEITGEYMYKNYIQKSSDGLRNGYAKNRTDVFPTKDGVIDYSVYEKKIKSFLPFYLKNEDFIRKRKIFNEKEMNKIVKKIHKFLGEKLSYQFLKNKGVYFSISGALNMGGTAFSGGVFVDISMIYDNKIDHSDLPPKKKKEYPNFFNEKENTFLVVHEFFHTFQFLLDENLLSNLSSKGRHLFYSSLIEGGANFFTSEILSKEKFPSQLKGHQEYMKYNPQKYLEFWNDIKKEEKIDNEEEKRKISLKWLYQGAGVSRDVPPDLGYYIGSKITQKFFEKEIKTRSRETVVKQILKLEIPDERIEKIIKELSEEM